MTCVMSYETNAEHLPLARLHFPAHRARLDEFHARGTLLMAGPCADPAEEIVAGDPFVLCGLVKALHPPRVE